MPILICSNCHKEVNVLFNVYCGPCYEKLCPPVVEQPKVKDKPVEKPKKEEPAPVEKPEPVKKKKG